MSTLKVNKLRDTAGSTDAIVLDPNGGAVLAGVTTVTNVKVGAAVTISESGIEATGVGITCANINGNQLGGRRNFFINGAMQVHQRNVSVTASGTYGMDRWWLAHNGTTTMARDTTVPSGEGFDYSIKLSNISGGDAAIGQPIELTSAGKQGGLASGKKITFSFYAKCDSGTDSITVICNFRQGKYSSTNQVGFTNSGAAVTLTTTWTRHIVTMTIPTCHSGSTMAAFELNGISGTSYFTGFQMEIGNQATPFENRSVGEELALCQRYYETSYPSGYSAGHNFNEEYPFNTSKPIAQNYIASDDTTTAVSYPFMVTKRANPTVTIYSAKDGTSGQAWTYKGTGGNNANDALNVTQTREQSVMLTCFLGAVNQASEKYFHYTAESEL